MVLFRRTDSTMPCSLGLLRGAFEQDAGPYAP